ncbi:HAD family hydrolase [Nocardiopsis sp. YSL2]|uniref:HAD family hydrolase n=1 Tax=Nocardiopsis sp. YSL2 TaxID=2939492 RepID=UPI0026F427B8|nr:HAD family hydrolase [Nocardiopsis sp. YSL2]
MVFPRVIATDLDGTLLRPDGSLSARSRHALGLAAEAGARVVVATARPRRATDIVSDQLDCGAVVWNNGSHFRTVGGSDRFRAIGPPTARTVIEKLGQALPEPGFGVETGAAFFHEPAYRPGPMSVGWEREVVYSTEELVDRATPVAKLVVRSPDEPVHLMHEAAVTAVGPLVEITYSGAHSLLELSAPGVTKGSTLALLCEEWGVAAEEVVAFGDMPNDLPALTWAGRGYAMAGGHPGLLDPALGLHRAPSNREDGVAQIVERLLTDL